MAECDPVTTPSDMSDGGSDAKCNYSVPYRESMVILMHLMVGTRSDIAFAVNKVARCLKNLTESDMIEIKRILKYLKRTNQLGLRCNITGGYRLCRWYQNEEVNDRSRAEASMMWSFADQLSLEDDNTFKNGSLVRGCHGEWCQGGHLAEAVNAKQFYHKWSTSVANRQREYG